LADRIFQLELLLFKPVDRIAIGQWSAFFLFEHHLDFGMLGFQGGQMVVIHQLLLKPVAQNEGLDAPQAE
jgi:hypothetical protein